MLSSLHLDDNFGEDDQAWHSDVDELVLHTHPLDETDRQMYLRNQSDLVDAVQSMQIDSDTLEAYRSDDANNCFDSSSEQQTLTLPLTSHQPPAQNSHPQMMVDLSRIPTQDELLSFIRQLVPQQQHTTNPPSTQHNPLQSTTEAQSSTPPPQRPPIPSNLNQAEAPHASQQPTKAPAVPQVTTSDMPLYHPDDFIRKAPPPTPIHPNTHRTPSRQSPSKQVLTERQRSVSPRDSLLDVDTIIDAAYASDEGTPGGHEGGGLSYGQILQRLDSGSQGQSSGPGGAAAPGGVHVSDAQILSAIAEINGKATGGQQDYLGSIVEEGFMGMNKQESVAKLRVEEQLGQQGKGADHSAPAQSVILEATEDEAVSELNSLFKEQPPIKILKTASSQDVSQGVQSFSEGWDSEH